MAHDIKPSVKGRPKKVATAVFANNEADAAVPFHLDAEMSAVAGAIDPAAAHAMIETVTVPGIPVADSATADPGAPAASAAAADDRPVGFASTFADDGDLAAAATTPIAEAVLASTDAVITPLAASLEAAEPLAASLEAAEPLAERADAAVTQASDRVQPVLSKGSTTMATAFDTTGATNAAASTAAAFIGDINGRAKGAMEKSVKLAETMTDFHKGNLEALVASGRVAANGVGSMAQDAAETARANFAQATTTFKSFASVKSPTELFQLQSDYARSTFDQLVAAASKTSERMLKLAGDIAQPLSSRYAVASEQVKTAAL